MAKAVNHWNKTKKQVLAQCKSFLALEYMSVGRLSFVFIMLAISMLSIECKCGSRKSDNETNADQNNQDDQELDRLIKLVRDKLAQHPKLDALLEVLEKVKKGERVVDYISGVNWKGYETALYDAVKFFDEPTLIEQLIKHGFIVGLEQAIAITKNRSALLYKAIESDHLQVAKFLIQHGSNINEQDPQKRTPLHAAIVNKRTEALKWLIDKGASLESPSDEPYLVLAAINNYLEGVNILLQKSQINVNTKDKNGRTALHYAAQKGNAAIVQAILDTKKADVRIKTGDFYENTPLTNAAASKNTVIVNMLVAYNSHLDHLNAQNAQNNTAIFIAAFYNQPEIVQILRGAGADANIPGQNGKTAEEILSSKKN